MRSCEWGMARVVQDRFFRSPAHFRHYFRQLPDIWMVQMGGWSRILRHLKNVSPLWQDANRITDNADEDYRQLPFSKCGDQLFLFFDGSEPVHGFLFLSVRSARAFARACNSHLHMIDDES